MIKLTAVALTTLALATPSLAATGLRPVFGVAVTGGGEKLVTVTYVNGGTQTVKSGGLLHLFGGVEYDAPAFAIQANVGYHVDDTSATNGSVKFARMPLELLAFWRASDTWRLGGGVRKAGSAKISSSGAASNVGSATLDSQAGLVLQGEYAFWGDRGSVYLRSVTETYTVNRVDISGNHVGLGFAFRF